jgi:hypothetical protein
VRCTFGIKKVLPSGSRHNHMTLPRTTTICFSSRSQVLPRWQRRRWISRANDAANFKFRSRKVKVTDDDATFKEDLLHGSQAQGEAIHQLQGAVDHGVGEAILGITGGMGERSGHSLEFTPAAPT